MLTFRMEDKFVHMEFHKDKMFLCAACPKRKEFDNFVKVRQAFVS